MEKGSWQGAISSKADCCEFVESSNRDLASAGATASQRTLDKGSSSEEEKSEKDERNPRDHGCIVKAALSQRARIHAQSIGLRVRRCEPVPRARLDFRRGIRSRAKETGFLQPSSDVSDQGFARTAFLGAERKNRRKKQKRKKKQRRFIRETEVDRDAKTRPLGVRFYLSHRGFLFHGKYSGHLGVRRSPIYGLRPAPSPSSYSFASSSALESFSPPDSKRSPSGSSCRFRPSASRLLFYPTFIQSQSNVHFSALSFQINMEAVTSTDYDSSNLSRNFNQVGFNTYNYSQFEEKYKPRQVFKYGDEYLEYGRNSVRLGLNERFARLSSRHQDGVGKIDQRYLRSHSQPERQHHSTHETRSKSQDSRELTFYQIDPPVRAENVQHHSKAHRSAVEKGQGKKELTFYEIDGPATQEKAKDGKFESCKDRSDKRDKSHTVQEKAIPPKHAKQGHQEQKTSAPPNYQLNRSQSDLTECQLPNYYRHQNNPYIDPPKYRQFDRPPKYQETPPRSEPPPKYSEVARRQDDYKRVQVSPTLVCISAFLSCCQESFSCSLDSYIPSFLRELSFHEFRTISGNA